MKNQPEKKKEAPGKPDNKGKMELPGQPRKQEKEEKKKEDQDAGPLNQEDYSSPKNQSGKNTSPDSED